MPEAKSRTSPAAPNDQIYVSTSDRPFWVYDEWWEPNYEVRRPIFAVHHMVELGIVLSGRMRVHYSQWTTDLGPGDVWFTGIWERHVCVPLDKEPGEEITVMVQPAALMQMNWTDIRRWTGRSPSKCRRSTGR